MFTEQLVTRKRETKKGLGCNLVRIYRQPRKENVALLTQVATRNNLMVIRCSEPAEIPVEPGRVRVEIKPLPGYGMPDWIGFWKEYKQAKKNR